MDGGADPSSPGPGCSPAAAAGWLIGWFVHGSLCTVAGFFSSGRGIGGASGFAADGCTVGASGTSAFWAGCVCAGCPCAGLPDACAAISGTLTLKHPATNAGKTNAGKRTSAVASHFALPRPVLFPVTVSLLTSTIRSLHKGRRSQPSPAAPAARTDRRVRPVPRENTVICLGCPNLSIWCI